MINLTHYQDDPFVAFQRIVECKREPQRTILLSVSENVRQRYQHYWDNQHNLISILNENYSSDVKNALRHCYDVETEELNCLLKNIRQLPQKFGHQASRCQYCGIGPGFTFDHYLPKESYPEYAAYAINLVTCCSDCNTRKGAIFMIDGQRQFINLYFDNLPDAQFLYVDIIFSVENIPIPTFYIKNIPELSADLSAVINAHFQKLKLYERYQDNISEVISELISGIQQNNLEENISQIVELLRYESGKKTRMFGPNYWQAVLIEALAGSEHFLTKTVKFYTREPSRNIRI